MNISPVYIPLQPNPYYLAHPSLAYAMGVTPSARSANGTYLHDVYVPTVAVVTGFTIARGGVSAGNFDLGIYDINGNLLGHTGITVAGAINTLQTVTLTTPIVLAPGTYYFAIWVDNNTDTFYAPTISVRGTAGPILNSSSLVAGGLQINFAAMGGTGLAGVIIPFFAHIQGGY